MVIDFWERVMKLGNVLIIGDSYSTFEGFIPQGYACCYKLDPCFADVDCVEKTWWWQVINALDGKLLLNDSWSGSTICHTGYNGQDRSDNSFVARLNNYLQQGYFNDNTPDTVFVFGGTNDNWAGSPLGQVEYSGWTKQTLYSFFPALACLLDSLQKGLPNANVYVIINTDLKKELVEGVKTICNHYGIKFIELNGIQKVNGHPDALGMRQLASQVISGLSK